MNDKTVIVECGVIETRAALILGDTVRRFWFGPAMGDEGSAAALETPPPGAAVVGRVLERAPAGGGYFIDIGASVAAFHEGKSSAPKLVQGALVRGVVTHAARENKGPKLGDIAPAPFGAAIGFAGAPESPAVQAVRALASGGGVGVDAGVMIDSGAAKRDIEDAFQDERRLKVDHRATALFDEFGASAALEDAFAREILLVSGASLIIEETAALTAIDIDTGGASLGDKERRLNVNIEAAQRAALEIARRDIGGQIVIDFLKVSRNAEGVMQQKLKKAFPGAQKAGWTKSGLFAFTLPRPAASLSERFTERAPGDPAPGRWFTCAWLVRTAVRQLEARATASPRAKLSLHLGDALFGCFADPALIPSNVKERLHKRFGVRIFISHAPHLGAREYDLIEE